MCFQIFGSATSTDLDVVYFVDEIPPIAQAAAICKQFGEKLQGDISTNKKIDVNIAKLGDGMLLGVHKGTTDELNNTLYHTYALHRQYHPPQITELLARDVELKMLRCARKILSFFSRTALRPSIKTALRGNFLDKIKVLETIRLADYQDFGKKGSLIEFRKSLAFQLGQTIALCDGQELYTKATIAARYPELRPLLQREASKNEDLQPFLEIFIKKSWGRMDEMAPRKEPTRN